MRGACHCPVEVVEKCITWLCHAPMTVEEVQYFVHQDKDRAVCCLKESKKRFCSGWCGFGRCSKRFNALFAGQLPGNVNPRSFLPFTRVPCITYKDGNFCLRDFCKTCAFYKV